MTRAAGVACLMFALAACQKNPPRVDLGVDLYLHPETATAEDAILQAAIRRQIVEALKPNAGLVHVRVIDKIVFLSGSVASDQDRMKAETIARNIDVRVNGTAIQPTDLHLERLQVAK